MDCVFARYLLANSQGDIQDLDDDIKCHIFTQQNQWLQSVKLVTVGRFNHIDREYDIGFSKCYSLCEFMRKQLTRDQTVPIDVENGGSGGKTTIVVRPEHYQHAKLTFAEFRGLTKQPMTINPMEVDNDDDTATYSNASSYSERMKEIFGQDISKESLSSLDPMEVDEWSKPNTSKQAQKKSKKTSKARPNASQQTKAFILVAVLYPWQHNWYMLSLWIHQSLDVKMAQRNLTPVTQLLQSRRRNLERQSRWVVPSSMFSKVWERHRADMAKVRSPLKSRGRRKGCEVNLEWKNFSNMTYRANLLKQ
jgi:hypothetical protein